MNFDQEQNLPSDILLDQLNALDKTDPEYEEKKQKILEKIKANQGDDQAVIATKREEQRRHEKGLDTDSALSFEDMMLHINAQVVEKLGTNAEKYMEAVNSLVTSVDKLGLQLAKLMTMFDQTDGQFYQQEGQRLRHDLTNELNKLRKEDITTADIREIRTKAKQIYEKYLELVKRAFLELRNKREQKNREKDKE